MTKKCPVCSLENNHDSKFCSNCGHKFSAAIHHYDGFISYRRDNGGDLASLMKIGIELLGNKNLFLDVEELNTGVFDSKLIEIINKSKNFLLILSKNSLDRCNIEGDWLRREIECAISGNKNIIPITTPNFEFPDEKDLPPCIRPILRYNAVKYDHQFRQAAFQKILSFMIFDAAQQESIPKREDPTRPAPAIAPPRPNMSEKIRSILTTHQKNYQSDEIGVSPNINDTVLLPAMEECAFPKDDNVLGLIIKDRTIFGGKANCIIFGEKAIYYHNIWPGKKVGTFAALYETFPNRKFSYFFKEINIGFDNYIAAQLNGKIITSILQDIKKYME